MKAKHIVILFLSICAGAAMFALYQNYRLRAIPAAAVNDWGLRFESYGEPPVPNAPTEYLAGFNARWIGDKSKPVLYLTFNAGYENGYTEEILDTLRASDVPAAFFMTGSALKGAGGLISRMENEGHAVGCHTYSHADVSTLTTRAAFERELELWNAEFFALTGKSAKKLYRPPSGQLYEFNLEHAKALGYKTYFYSCAYADWDNAKQPDEAAALKTLDARTHNGAVIMLHSTSRTNARVLGRYIEQCRARGFEFAPLDTLY